MTQSLSATQTALYEACVDLYDSIYDSVNGKAAVSFGAPGNYQPGIIIGVAMDTRQPIERPTMGANRSREKTAEIDILFSVYVPGDHTKQKVATDSCNTLTGMLEDYFRVKPNEELGGACRVAWVSNIDGPKTGASTNPTNGAAMGRIADATVTVTAAIRY